jgi:glucose-6-phosphate 1-dehydrogenase
MCRSRSPRRWASRAARATTSGRRDPDIFQNHLLQLLALTAMEPPIDFTRRGAQREGEGAPRDAHPGPKSVVRGQYGRGWVEGRAGRGYREEPGVDPAR